MQQSQSSWCAPGRGPSNLEYFIPIGSFSFSRWFMFFGQTIHLLQEEGSSPQKRWVVFFNPLTRFDQPQDLRIIIVPSCLICPKRICFNITTFDMNFDGFAPSQKIDTDNFQTRYISGTIRIQNTIPMQFYWYLMHWLDRSNCRRRYHTAIGCWRVGVCPTCGN